MNENIEKLITYIKEEVGYGGTIDPDADLLEEKILDSFSVVDIATFIQSNFAVELEGEDLVRENFNSISSMDALITKRQK